MKWRIGRSESTELTASERTARLGVHRAFVAALLLTGSAERAEYAVLSAIDRLDPDHLSERALLIETVRASLETADSGLPLPQGA